MQNNPTDLFILQQASDSQGCYLYQIAMTAKPRLFFSTVKSVLDRLERDRLIFSTEETVHGRKRRVYFITVAGLNRLEHLHIFYRELVRDYKKR